MSVTIEIFGAQAQFTGNPWVMVILETLWVGGIMLALLIAWSFVKDAFVALRRKVGRS